MAVEAMDEIAPIAAARRWGALLPARPFVVNDPEYKPFGLTILRGVTPARLALVAVLAALYRFRRGPHFVRDGLTWDYLVLLLRSIVFFSTAAFPMLLVIAHTLRETAGNRTASRILSLAGAVVAGSALFITSVYGMVRAFSLPGNAFTVNLYTPFPTLLNLFYQALLAGGLATAIAYVLARGREADQRRHAAERWKSALERELVEARLRMLQAQIEPHFLFNSLASVKRLYETDPARGRAMIRSLRGYLGEAIPMSRLRETPLGEEVRLATAYLEVLKVRMGARLETRVQVSPDVVDRPVPPLMLVTLVENAVKHGIAPRAEGGRVAIEANRGDAFVEIRVIDDGIGFREHSGTGVGLANTRARLRTLYGAAARLDLARNPGGGVVATIRLPDSHLARVEKVA